MKKRLTASVIALIVGAGAVHATGMNTGSLSGWYEGAFHKESERIAKAAAGEMAGMLADAGMFVLEAGEWAEDQIVSWTETEEQRAERELNARVAEIRSQLDSTAARLDTELRDGIADPRELEAQIEADVNRLFEEILNEH
ncbi:hypothetical protein [Edaphobacillus lindanitolerans]|uniref:Gas vesicle protein n=1 Tax=Edaphobacillus lindanitolerans TaxID=550447 RepID=A0A1U7PKL5_9BACI|nr:hypothetical protein [Edaphobacillus lindanitolerans]SIT71450.1 hypothetical protein SAMN05428946_0728 [Edaphobacillus lindanitolerans]